MNYQIFFLEILILQLSYTYTIEDIKARGFFLRF